MENNKEENSCPIEAVNLTMAYGSRVIQRDLNFKIAKGSTFVIMGGSGCGKSTLLRHLVGLQKPAAGQILRNGLDFWRCTPEEQDRGLPQAGPPSTCMTRSAAPSAPQRGAAGGRHLGEQSIRQNKRRQGFRRSEKYRNSQDLIQDPEQVLKIRTAGSGTTESNLLSFVLPVELTAFFH